MYIVIIRVTSKYIRNICKKTIKEEKWRTKTYLTNLKETWKGGTKKEVTDGTN